MSNTEDRRCVEAMRMILRGRKPPSDYRFAVALGIQRGFISYDKENGTFDVTDDGQDEIDGWLKTGKIFS